MMNPAIIRDVLLDDERLTFVLTDGRAVSCPISWSSRLVRATGAQRAAWQIGSSGTHVEWPSIDEHIGVWTLLGVPEEDVLEAAGFAVSRPTVHA